MKKLFKLLLIALIVLPSMNVIGQPPMPSKEKKLNLTVMLQGLYNGVDMSKAQDFVAGNPVDKFTATIADVITVELHDAGNYATIVYTAPDVELLQNGTTSTSGKTYISIPNNFNGSYYITVKHRNHVETTSASPVTFSDANITYNFTTAAAQAYSNNLMQVNPGVFCIFAGDVNQDGFVSVADRDDFVHVAVVNLVKGYVAEDINGDGIVAVGDRDDLVHPNVVALIRARTPLNP